MHSLRLSVILSLLMSTILMADHHAGGAAGHWATVTTLPEGNELESEMMLAKEGDGWKGTVSSERWDEPRAFTSVSVDGKELALVLPIQYEGADLTFRIAAKATGADGYAGKWMAEDLDGNELATGDWEAIRIQPEPNPLVGDWDASAEGPDGEDLDFDMTVSESEDSLVATLKADSGELKVDAISLDDDKVTIKVPYPYEGGAVPVTIAATLKGDVIEGEWSASADGEDYSGAWTAKRKSDQAELAGEWNLAAVLDDGSTAKTICVIEKEGDSWKGHFAREDGDAIKLDKIDLVEGEVTIDFLYPYDGTDVDIRIKATFDGDDAWKGKWVSFDSSGQEDSSGDVSASRKTDS